MAGGRKEKRSPGFSQMHTNISGPRMRVVSLIVAWGLNAYVCIYMGTGILHPAPARLAFIFPLAQLYSAGQQEEIKP